ncbi:MAG: efflux RND transporter periplasmic adaptor subunit [Thermoanaerobaculia bacterium]|nr:efflux RND transporter periplasmic adaptor subunit [Thermoanaerobaculia bacterium]
MAILAFTACHSDRTQETVSAPEVFPVTRPIVLDTVFTREYVADIQSMQHVEIRARVNGFLEKIHVDEGQEVRAGQLLFTLSGKELREELRRAQAALNSAVAEARIAEVEVANTRTLFEKNIVSKPELHMAEAKLQALEAKIEEARAAVSAAQLQVSFTEIRAPFAGILNRQPNKVGSLINDGDLLTTISSNKDVFVYFNVSEKEYLELMKRSEAGWKKNLSLQLANGQIHPHQGSVETAETVVDKNTGSIAFRARFPNPGHLLKHGASGKVLVYDELKNALVVPQKSTFDVQDKTYVFVLNKENKIERRAIAPKLRLGHLYVVGSGLTTHDRVIYEGIQQVREGDSIEAQEIPLQDIIPTLAMR